MRGVRAPLRESRRVPMRPRRMSAGAQLLVPPVVMPAWQVIHAVRPVVPDVDLWECLATCPFLGAREDAIAHAVSNQFSLVPR